MKYPTGIKVTVLYQIKKGVSLEKISNDSTIPVQTLQNWKREYIVNPKGKKEKELKNKFITTYSDTKGNETQTAKRMKVSRNKVRKLVLQYANELNTEYLATCLFISNVNFDNLQIAFMLGLSEARVKKLRSKFNKKCSIVSNETI